MLTVHQAAELLDVEISAVYNAMSGGRLPFALVFGRKVIKREEAQAYKDRTRPGGEKPRGRPKGSKSKPRSESKQAAEKQE